MPHIGRGCLTASLPRGGRCCRRLGRSQSPQPERGRSSGEVFRFERARSLTLGAPTETINILDRQGRVASSITGTVRVCNDPDLIVLDVDRDGDSDIYYRTCNDRGYLAYEEGQFTRVDLGQPHPGEPSGLNTFWAHQVGDGGRTMYVAGGLGIAAGVVSLCSMLLLRAAIGLITLVRKRTRRRHVHD